MRLRTGVTVGVGRIGSGPAVLLLGGLGMPSLVWEISGLTEQLADAGFDVVSHTARGIPPASSPPAPYSVDDLARDAAAVLEELNLTSNVTVIGYSLGAFVAQTLLRDRPDNFRAAVLIAGLNPSPLVEIVDTMEIELIDATGTLPSSVSTFELLMTTLPPATIQDQDALPVWHSIFADDADRWSGIDGLKGQVAASRDWVRSKQAHLDNLPYIKIPVLSISFEHDLFFPPTDQRKAAATIPDCKHVEIPEAAHGGLSTHAKEPVKCIVEFCSRLA